MKQANKFILYRIIRMILNPVFKLLYRPKIIGIENVPTDKKSIIVGNHTCFLDSVLMVTTIKRTVRFLAKKELIDSKLGFLFRRVGIIPVDRKKPSATIYKEVDKILNQNGLVCIFPEGTINLTSDIIMPFKKGAVRMAFQNNTPIIPFVIVGKYQLFRKSLKIVFLKPHVVKTDDFEKEIKMLEKVIIDQLINERRK